MKILPTFLAALSTVFAASPGISGTFVQTVRFNSNFGSELARWNQSLGTLQSVLVETDYSFSAAGRLSLSGTADVAVTLVAALKTDITRLVSITKTETKGYTDISPANPTYISSGGSSIDMFTGGDIWQFIGYGSIIFTPTGGSRLASSALVVSGLPEQFSYFYDGRLSSFNATSRVTYTYDETMRGYVPEPETWTMMLAGLGLAGAAIRRRPMRSMA